MLSGTSSSEIEITGAENNAVDGNDKSAECDEVGRRYAVSSILAAVIAGEALGGGAA